MEFVEENENKSTEDVKSEVIIENIENTTSETKKKKKKRRKKRSKKSQKKRKNHQSFPFEIREGAKGRSVFSSCHLEEGNVIIIERPYCVIFSSPVCCTSCGSLMIASEPLSHPSDEEKAQDDPSRTWYCSHECLVSYEPFHLLVSIILVVYWLFDRKM